MYSRADSAIAAAEANALRGQQACTVPQGPAAALPLSRVAVIVVDSECQNSTILHEHVGDVLDGGGIELSCRLVDLVGD